MPQADVRLRRIRFEVGVSKEFAEPFEKVLNARSVLWVRRQLQRPTVSRLQHLLIKTVEYSTGASRAGFRQEGNHKGAPIKDCNDIAGSEQPERVFCGGPSHLEPGRVIAKSWRLNHDDRKGSVVACVPLNLDTQIVEQRPRTAELLLYLLLNILGFGHRTHYQLNARRSTRHPIRSMESRP